MASWAPRYAEELARVRLERSDFADRCVGVNGDGQRGSLFFDHLHRYDREIARLEQLANKEAA